MLFFNQRRNIVILCLGLVVMSALHCRQRNDQAAAHESTITLLCPGKSEQNVFRDGGPNMSLLFLHLFPMDEEDESQSWLLESWEHTEDYTEWILHLRKDVKWDDGNPVTARDVKFTIELYTGPGLLYEAKVFDEITIIDDFTCRLRSKKPFDADIYNYYGICPEHLLGDLDTSNFFSWEFWKHPVGNGPYRYVRHVPQTMVELAVNPDYIGGKPRIERVILKFAGNPLTELMSGNVDAVENLPTIDALKLAEDPRFNLYHSIDVATVISIIWNHQNPMFNKPGVRRALTLAINRQELHQLLNLPNNIPIFDVPITQSQFYSSETPEPVPYDPEQAGRLLDMEGWVRPGESGVREKNGQEFRFTLNFFEDVMPSAVYIQEQFRKIGIIMEIAPLERTILNDRRVSGKFEAQLQRFMVFSPDWGFGGYINPEFKRLLQAIIRSYDRAGFENLIRKIRPIFEKDLPWLFLYPFVNFNIVHKRIRGLKSPTRAYPTEIMEQLWIEEEKE